MTTPNSDVKEPSDPTDIGAKQQTWIAHHNETIIGFYDNQGDAQNAINGYQMTTPIAIDDTLEVLKVTQ